MFDRTSLYKWTAHQSLRDWIEMAIDLCKPSQVHLCDGSDEEYDNLCRILVQSKAFIPLNPEKRPHSFLCRSDPGDVARVEEATFICSRKKEDAGPTNNWKDPKEMKDILFRLFSGCMKGRTLYVIPFSMGPLGSSLSRIGVQITDSPYVACSMKIMTRMGKSVLEKLGNQDFFVPCMHSVGKPLMQGEQDVAWPCNPKEKYIVHFPEEKTIWSYGSGYGGNALLGKKSLALRIASVIGREQNWMAEHMLIIAVTNPEGKKKYMAAAFPSLCGKTNLAMLNSALPGWKVECVGDDIAWLQPKSDGRFYAINPEAGFFGVAPGTSFQSNPNAMATITRNAIFTNVALTAEGDVWWEGMTPAPPPGLTDWRGQKWDPSCAQPAAHPNGRFTVPTRQCPMIDSHWEDPVGVPISAILFGGRRSSVVPLVYEAFSWQHGVFLGASVSSETTAAAVGAVGKLRHDPFAMLPFCGYHMGDYFAHWLKMGAKLPESAQPPIYYVNWFRKDKEGKWLWPGFGENIRVLKWIFERTEEKGSYQTTPIGRVPTADALDLTGVNVSMDQMRLLFDVPIDEWKKEVETLRAYFSLFGNKMPDAILQELDALERRLSDAHCSPKSETC
jgi:phosphoenolpyruvate carboxykinase (GTP)